MDLSPFANISVSHLVTPEFNAIYFSLFGMGLVFSGLLVISLYILALPKLLKLPGWWRSRRRPETPGAEEEVVAGANRDDEVLLAIATAFYLHQDFPEEQEKITFKGHGDLDSAWKISGRVRGLSMRNPSAMRRKIGGK
ncbi:MAG: OadG family protein [Thermodesulfobacteriota bacterium]